jgi:KaiC/GvpD/RAD55 family RecA-like ATPase
VPCIFPVLQCDTKTKFPISVQQTRAVHTIKKAFHLSKEMRKVSPQPTAVPRVSTGSAGLDDILTGGLPSGRMYLLEGEPGTGKTTLAMKFLLTGAVEGVSTLYITLSETAEELRSSSATHGWDISRVQMLELIPEEPDAPGSSEYTVFYPTEVELSNTVRRILEEVERLDPSMVVIDSVSELRLLAGDPIRYRRQLLAIKQFFAHRKATVLILDDRSSGPDDLQLHSIAHGVPSCRASMASRAAIWKCSSCAVRVFAKAITTTSSNLAACTSFPAWSLQNMSAKWTKGRCPAGLQTWTGCSAAAWAVAPARW